MLKGGFPHRVWDQGENKLWSSRPRDDEDEKRREDLIDKRAEHKANQRRRLTWRST